MRILALHRLPFEPERLARDLESVEADDRPEIERQFRDHHENAWIIVIEDDTPIDFNAFSHPDVGPDAQAPWMEQELEAEDTAHRGAFFLHYVDPTKPLWYDGKPHNFPAVTPAPTELIDQLDYESP